MHQCIDIHTHVVPENFPSYSGTNSNVPWPSMRHTSCGHAQVMISGKVYRSVEDGCWSAPRRLDQMAAMGVSHQVLSPMPELLSYWLPLEDTVTLGDYLNTEIAKIAAAAPDRFTAFGTVPLQAPELAAEKLTDLKLRHRLDGVEIATNVLGRPIGAPEFEPFFAAAAELGVPVLVHPVRPIGRTYLVGPIREQVAAFPGETGLAITSVITGGLLERHPDLKLAFCHGGGSFALNLPRLERAWLDSPEMQKVLPRSPRDYARRLFFDSLVYDKRTLEFLLESFGWTQITVGTDYPFSIMEREPVRRIDALSISDEHRRAILYDNARRFLGLDPSRK